VRYLYGDSAPFPHGYDFLATLERFLEDAARVVRLDSEMAELTADASAAELGRMQAIAALERLHLDVCQKLEDGGMRLGGDYAPDYAGRLLESATREIDEARRLAATRAEQEEQSLARALEQRHEEARRALEAFFLLGRLPILAAAIRMELHDGRPRMTADLVHEGGIVAELGLAADRIPEWQAPRRAGEFQPNLELLVGLKRGLFRRGERLEPVKLDDYVFGGFILNEDTAVLRLRRRPNEPDAYVFDVRLEEGRLVVEVTRPNETKESGEPSDATQLEEGDRRQVLSLWERLRRGVEGPLDRRERLTALLLDGEDVFETARYVPLLERLVRSFAHTISEVARRSPNREELSLKRESDGGDREELYVKKKDLTVRLEGLTETELALFAPLNLTT
jgi:hypothetical protein